MPWDKSNQAPRTLALQVTAPSIHPTICLMALDA
jgi:hypothetical protein